MEQRMHTYVCVIVITVWAIIIMAWWETNSYKSQPSQHSTLIYIGPSSARQGSWRADDGPM